MRERTKWVYETLEVRVKKYTKRPRYWILKKNSGNWWIGTVGGERVTFEERTIVLYHVYSYPYYIFLLPFPLYCLTQILFIPRYNFFHLQLYCRLPHLFESYLYRLGDVNCIPTNIWYVCWVYMLCEASIDK